VLLLQELPYKIIAQPVGGYEREQLIRVMEFLRGLNVEVALPIYYQDQLTAAVVFGAKAKKEIYSTQDIQLLETFGNQLALALANIKAYQKMKNYSEDLKKEVAAATAELQELNLKQSKFLADIAHELQSPVAILQGNLDLIQERGCLPALVENSSQSVGRLSRLIKDLLFLARADFGQLEIQKTEFDLNDLLREVYNTSQVFAEEKKINFQIKLPSKIKIFGDQEKLKSVFFNLLSNAFKHTPVGGEIIIATGKSSRKTKVSLYNSGLEIPVADLPHLFERFYHVDNGGRSSKEGVGLGLSIAKTIIEGHGGRIWAENVVDKGVKFWVEL
jgi:two-component system sensor histidine kinase BaeS